MNRPARAPLASVNIGPASAVDGKVALFDGTSGKLIKDSGVTLGSLASQSGTFSGTHSGASSGTNTGDQDLSGKVSTTRTVNGHALSSDVTVSLADVGAADIAAVNAGTSTTTAVTPDALAGSVMGSRSIEVQAIAKATDLTTGDGAFEFSIPEELNGMNLIAAVAFVNTAGTTNTTDIQIARVRSGTPADMLSAKLRIDSTETSTLTAANAVTINTSNDDVVTNDLIRIDIDAVSTTPPKGLRVRLRFMLP